MFVLSFYASEWLEHAIAAEEAASNKPSSEIDSSVLIVTVYYVPDAPAICIGGTMSYFMFIISFIQLRYYTIHKSDL